MNSLQAKKQCYFLIVGELVYSNPGETVIRTTRSNGVLVRPERELPIKAMGKCQEILQLNLFKRFADTGAVPTVHDVVISNLIFLGEFTKEEFFAGHEPSQSQSGL